MLNRKVFFDEVRQSLFGGALTQSQVEGINADLDVWEQYYPNGNPQHLAYILASDYWETAKTMQPIPERGGHAYLMRMYDVSGDRPDKARELGNTKVGDGATFTGGKVQLTGRTNFRRQGKKLGVPLEEQPELIYDMGISTNVLVRGMMDGDFSGKSLADYTDLSGNLNSIKARRVVNGNDNDKEIAAIYAKFLDAVEQAQTAPIPSTPKEEPIWSDNPVVGVAETAVPAVTLPVPQQPADYGEYLQWKQAQQRKATLKPKWQSKILLTVIGTLVSAWLVKFNVDLPADQIADILMAIISTGATLIGIFRLYFTKKALG